MPYTSVKQERWAHTDAGEKALGGPAKVHEWDQASKGLSLPMTHNKGHRSQSQHFAKGGPVLGKESEFLKTPDRFTGRKNGPLKDSSTDEDWGKGSSKANPAGKDKCLPAVKPRT